MSEFEGEEPTMDYAPNQVLPVANYLPMDFDGTPQDGLEYLFTVRRDAKSLPRYTRAPNPYEIPDTAAAAAPNDRAGALSSSSSSNMPSEEWKQAFLLKFTNYRTNLQQAIRRSKNTTESRSKNHNGSREEPKLPGFNNRENWWRFITGPTKTMETMEMMAKQSNMITTSGKGSEDIRKEDAAGDGGDDGEDVASSSGEAGEVEEGEDESISGDDQDMEVEGESPGPVLPGPGSETKTKTPVRAVASMTKAVINEGATKGTKVAAVVVVGEGQEPTLGILSRLSLRDMVQLLYWHSAWIDAYLDALEEEEEEEEGRKVRGAEVAEEEEKQQQQQKKKREIALGRAPGVIHQRWMFALLGALDDQLVSHDVSSLRTLARACLRLVLAKERWRARDGVGKQKEEDGSGKVGEMGVSVAEMGLGAMGEKGGDGLGGYWMVIVAIVGIWGQHDLWDEVHKAAAAAVKVVE
ncbi:hypothetical protein FRC17_000627 [Serendipita sp. 399]|nr:hypothetical protein FRC17_000627 [Serendipita sp. 399]